MKLEGWCIVGLDGTDSDTVSQLTAHARLLVAEEAVQLRDSSVTAARPQAANLGQRLVLSRTDGVELIGPNQARGLAPKLHAVEHCSKPNPAEAAD